MQSTRPGWSDQLPPVRKHMSTPCRRHDQKRSSTTRRSQQRRRRPATISPAPRVGTRRRTRLTWESLTVADRVAIGGGHTSLGIHHHGAHRAHSGADLPGARGQADRPLILSDGPANAIPALPTRSVARTRPRPTLCLFRHHRWRRSAHDDSVFRTGSRMPGPGARCSGKRVSRAGRAARLRPLCRSPSLRWRP